MKSIADHIKQLMNRHEMTEEYKEIMQDVFSDSDVKQFIKTHADKLDREAILRSSSKFYEFVVEKEKFQKNQDGLMPGYFPRLYVHNNRVEVEYVPSQNEIRRKKEKEIKNRIQSYYMPKNLKEARLDDLFMSDNRQELMEAILSFINNYQNNPNQFVKSLYIHGAYGVGKTFILGALAHELSTLGTQVALVHFPSLTVEMKQSISDNSVGDKLNAIKSAPILMIDDIGAESMSQWVRDDILGVILQYRLQEELPTFFSSNMDMKQLEDHLRVSQKGDNEPMKASRIMERIKFLANELELKGENRRK